MKLNLRRMLALALCTRQLADAFSPVSNRLMGRSIAIPSSHALGRSLGIRYHSASSEESAYDESRNKFSSTSSVNEGDRLAEYRNKNNVRDQVFSAISKDGGIKVTAATVRNLVNDFMVMHTMTAVPADAIGRLVTCSLLMSNGMQAEQTVQITMNGDGPLRGAMVIASGQGEVRGYVGSPSLGKMSIQEAVGKGTYKWSKNHPEWPNPYNGITAIRH